MTLASLRGRLVVLNFWATWCVPCEQEHHALTRAARALGSEVQFLGAVYDDEDDRVQSFLTRRGQAYPALMDPEGKTAIAYGVYGVPETYFINRDGIIVSKFKGPLSPSSLAEEIKKARAS